MWRRDFLTVTSAGALAHSLLTNPAESHDASSAHCENTYASPAEAMKSLREQLAFVPCLYVGTPRDKPDYLAVIDVDPPPGRTRVRAAVGLPPCGTAGAVRSPAWRSA